jgi:hypothetical protein
MDQLERFYTPFLDMGKNILRQSMPRPNPEATTGVPNPQRDDPYPRFDVLAARKRDRGAAQFAAEEGYEPRTAEELELASGVDRRIPDAPRTWGEPTTIPTLGSYALAPGGGYAIAHGTPPPVRDIAPRVPFADAAGESLAATAARGARMQAEQDRLGLTTADMDYIRSYGRKAWEERNAKYGAPSSREDYLRRQQGNLGVSVAERRAAGRELAAIERENAERARREEWALAQAQNLRLAEGGWQNAVDVQNAKNAGFVAQAMAEGQARVDAAKAQGASAEQVAATQAEAAAKAERIRAELQRQLAADYPWTAIGGGVMGNRATGEQAGRPNAAGGDAKPQVFKMKGADGSEKLVRANADGTGAEVIFEDPDAALAIAEQEVRNLESDRARYAFRDEQREDYDRQIEAAKGRVAALKAAMKGAPEYKGPTGAPPTNDAAGGWAAFGGLVE